MGIVKLTIVGVVMLFVASIVQSVIVRSLPVLVQIKIAKGLYNAKWYLISSLIITILIDVDIIGVIYSVIYLLYFR